jgi:hypothetical protein
MKFKITMKDPDGVYDSVTEAAKQSAAEAKGIDETEREELQESRRETIDQDIRQWFKYGEYLTVEIDTEAKTATVLNA